MTTNKITTFAQLKDRKKPVVKKVFVALDNEAADDFNNIALAYREAEQAFSEDPGNKALKADHDEKKAAYDEALANSSDIVVEFQFRSIGRHKFEELITNSPPTPKQKQQALKDNEDEPAWNPDTFMPGLLAASIVTPEISEEEMFELWDSEDWNMAELMSLFLAALQVNQTRKIVDLGKESGQTLDFGLN